MQRYGQDQTRGRLCNAEGVLHERILYGVISIEDDEFFGLQSFHEEDYQIYYNNIKDNVAKRIAAYKNKNYDDDNG